VNASGNGSSIQLPAVGEISSVLNPYIKHCVKLREKARYRQEQGRLLLVGSTLLSELAGVCSCSRELASRSRAAATNDQRSTSTCRGHCAG
jgi:hypothetical protein